MSGRGCVDANADPEELLLPREVAEIFGVRTTTIARWARSGQLRYAMRTPGRQRRYRRGDIEMYLQELNERAGS